VAVSHILFEADAAALLEHMAGAVGETLLALHGARTVRQPCDPAHFLERVAAARTARMRDLSRTSACGLRITNSVYNDTGVLRNN